MGRKTVELQPQLVQAQEDLQQALKEACAVDLNKANTGELIHIDELLAIAGESAKKVISVRRRLHRDPTSTMSAGLTTTQELLAAAPERRVFEDANRITWTTFAVYPSKSTSDRARLPGPFQTGWLSFDSGSETRRLTPIPEAWMSLSDEELRTLCEQAKVSRRRPRGSGPN
jgi:hypothetical protein